LLDPAIIRRVFADESEVALPRGLEPLFSP
jgi:hypothetical protein